MLVILMNIFSPFFVYTLKGKKEALERGLARQEKVKRKLKEKQ